MDPLLSAKPVLVLFPSFNNSIINVSLTQV